MKYLLDTNACIVHLRNRNALLTQRVRAHQRSDLALCSVVVAELFNGAERSADPAKGRIKVETFIKPFRSLDLEKDG